MPGPARYAVYYAPPASDPLWAFGCAWLGRDAEGGSPAPRPALSGFAPGWLEQATAAPRRYGFHATLKPPFALAPGHDREALIAAVRVFAASRPPAEGPPLRPTRLGDFLALVPAGPAPMIEALAAATVESLDAFRAPPGEAELARRRVAGLDAREEAHLIRWGYPYVMDRFRFHLTLTGPLDRAEAERLGDALAPLVAPLCRPALAIAEIALFEALRPGEPFHLILRAPLGTIA